MGIVDFAVNYTEENGVRQWEMVATRLGFGCRHSWLAARPTRKEFREFKHWSYAFLAKAHTYDGDTFKVDGEEAVS